MRALISYDKDLEGLFVAEEEFEEEQAKAFLANVYNMLKGSLRLDAIYVVSSDKKRLFTIDSEEDFLRYVQLQSKDLSFRTYIKDVSQKYLNANLVSVFVSIFEDVPEGLTLENALELLQESRNQK